MFFYLQVVHYHTQGTTRRSTSDILCIFTGCLLAGCTLSYTGDNQTQYIWYVMYFCWLFTCRLYIIMHRGQPDAVYLTCYVFLVVVYLQAVHHHAEGTTRRSISDMFCISGGCPLAGCTLACTGDNQTQYIWHVIYFWWLFTCRLYIIMHRGQPDVVIYLPCYIFLVAVHLQVVH